MRIRLYRQWPGHCICCLILFWINVVNCHAMEADPQLQLIIEAMVQHEKIPGMIAAITDQNGIREIAATGVRKQNNPAGLNINDQVHLGSCTKAMTSVLIATLVDAGTVTWDLNVETALPQLAKSIDPAYRDLTLWDLATHRGGVPTNANNWWTHRDLPLHQRRLTILQETLAAQPTHKKGDYLYSNVSYVLAACMLEQLTGQTWETLLQERLFKPLHMTSAGFGMPGHEKLIDQPWGHIFTAGTWEPQFFDNAEVLGPAARVHCSIADWAKFLALFMDDSQQTLLSKKQLARLVTPHGDYAGGWLVYQRDWAHGKALFHDGTNTTWLAGVWLAPALNRSYIVVMNSFNKDSRRINEAMMARLIILNSKHKTDP